MKTQTKRHKKEDDPQVARRHTRSRQKKRNRHSIAHFVKSLHSLFMLMKTSWLWKNVIKKPASRARPKNRYQDKGFIKKPLTTILAAAMLLILAIVQVGDCKKQYVYKQHKTLDGRIAELVIIRNDMGPKEHEGCFKWDGIAAKLYLDHQFGHSWVDLQKEMLTKDFLTTWKVSNQERNHMAAVFFSLMQEADIQERALGSFTLNETMDIAHALCGERILTGGLPFQESSLMDTPTTEALVFSSNVIR
ncbi:MAG TPA: hypothetical protein VLX29_10160 [Nitrospirota bacterium]|nr:hypothetical protein [Nitrospirota bacterium]